MAVTYTKLWHLLLDRGMKKKDLQQAAELTNHTMLKLRNNQDITTETIGKICKALGCTMDDIMEFYDVEK
jgi:DNA-binding Xre family transcriptional regulator